MNEDAIKQVLRMMPYGFYSITSRSGDDVNAMVANWLMQVSFEPRLVALGLSKTAYTHGLVGQSRVFAVNLFRREDQEAIKPFSKGRAKKPEKMEGAPHTPAPVTGCPLLAGAAAYLECRVTQIVDTGGDHDLVIAEVVGAGVVTPAEPADMLTLPDLGWSYAG
jgi:flavin reductase (DIM6/NTAB) family NADH-FMN oxidoreductase RutF